MVVARYWQGARLALHVDRLSTHVLSAILCLAKVFDQDGCDVMRLTLPSRIFTCVPNKRIQGLINNQEGEEDWPLQILDNQGTPHEVMSS